MSVTCIINFENNPHKIVFSGRRLRITVRIKLPKKTEVRAAYILLRGVAHVRCPVNEANVPIYYPPYVLDMRKCLVNENGN